MNRHTAFAAVGELIRLAAKLTDLAEQGSRAAGAVRRFILLFSPGIRNVAWGHQPFHEAGNWRFSAASFGRSWTTM